MSSKTRRLLIIFLAAVLVGIGMGIYSNWTDGKADAAPQPDVRLIAGHRGTTKGADENTISAMDYAYRAHADILETDVRLTADKKMVIMHDATLDRTTNCTGRVASRTLAYIKLCKTPRRSHPPSLRQLLVWADAKATPTLYLELKGTWTQAQVQRFVDEVASHDVDATAQSASAANLDKVVRANDALPDETAGNHLDVAFIEGGAPTMPPFRVCDRYDGYINSLAYLKAAYVNQLQQVCNPPTAVAVYGSLDTVAELEQAYQTGARILIVEDPKQAVAWLADR